jgi:hypothetical protein
MRKTFCIFLVVVVTVALVFGVDVRILSPEDGSTVSGVVEIKVEVNDPTNGLEKVEFYMGNYKIYGTSKPPFAFELDTSKYPWGTREIKVVAYGKDEVARDKVTIYVEEKDVFKFFTENVVPSGVVRTLDGGFLVYGRTSDLFKTLAFFMKFDSNGLLEWTRNLSGRGLDFRSLNVPRDVILTDDGGYLVLAETFSNAFDTDIYLYKLDTSGELLWDKTFGGSGSDGAYDLIAMNDGSYLILGHYYLRESYETNAYIIKVDKDGKKLWEKTYNLGDSNSSAVALLGSDDKGFSVLIANGFRIYNVFEDDMKNKLSSSEFKIVNFDANGNRLAVKTFLEGYTTLEKVIKNNDGTFLILGSRNTDAYIAKFSAKGNLIWEQKVGSVNDEIFNDAVETPDKGLLVVGSSKSFGDGTTADLILVKLDDNGNLVWMRSYGSAVYSEWATAIIPSAEYGKFMIIGHRTSINPKSLFDVNPALFVSVVDSEGKVVEIESKQEDDEYVEEIESEEEYPAEETTVEEDYTTEEATDEYYNETFEYKGQDFYYDGPQFKTWRLMSPEELLAISWINEIIERGLEDAKAEVVANWMWLIRFIFEEFIRNENINDFDITSISIYSLVEMGYLSQKPKGYELKVELDEDDANSYVVTVEYWLGDVKLRRVQYYEPSVEENDEGNIVYKFKVRRIQKESEDGGKESSFSNVFDALLSAKASQVAQNFRNIKAAFENYFYTEKPADPTQVTIDDLKNSGYLSNVPTGFSITVTAGAGGVYNVTITYSGKDVDADKVRANGLKEIAGNTGDNLTLTFSVQKWW